MVRVEDMPTIWEQIQRERNALLESRGTEKRNAVDWLDAVAQRVNAKRLAAGEAPWPDEAIWKTWLVMSIQEQTHWEGVAAELARRAALPIDMILYCPNCHVQHVDAPEPETGWTNPPHRSHKCGACQTIWRPADVATNGVLLIQTAGSADTWVAPPNA